MNERTEPVKSAVRGLAVEGARHAIQHLPASKIREVANLGMDQQGVIPLWFGESDEVTPDFICAAAAQALAEGDTFYQLNLGIPALRDRLAAYMNGLYGTALGAERVAVTVSGMNALMIAMQAVLERGDGMVTTAPIWPNLPGVGHVIGADVRAVPLTPGNAGWRLDLDRLFDACDASTRAILIKSPSNPTGWMMTGDEQRVVLDFARRRGIWVVADEVYARIVYDRPVAPSFLHIAEAEDRVMIINSFSKTWVMTGWRLGWITAPASMAAVLEKLMEFNIACAPGFIQQAGLRAIKEGEDFVRDTVRRYGEARDLTVARLGAHGRVSLPTPEAAFYAFFTVDGVDDGVEFAKRALTECQVGLAPGEAFGDHSPGYLRLCFATGPDKLNQAFDRLAPLLD